MMFAQDVKHAAAFVLTRFTLMNKLKLTEVLVSVVCDVLKNVLLQAL